MSPLRRIAHRNLTIASVPLAVLSAVAASAVCSGCFVSTREHRALEAKVSQFEIDSRAEASAIRAELEAVRSRLDHALRANADSSGDVLASKERLNDLAGRLDELVHHTDELRRDVGASRTELHARIDELKRAQQQQTVAAAPPAVIPADRLAHFKTLEEAFAKKDWPAVRALAPEYVNRYPTDDKSDESLFFLGTADLQDGRPSSALGQFNRLLKLFPRSNMLDRTLFSMGEAYLVMHDCVNAKVAFDACEKRFSKEKIGAEARAKIAQITAHPVGLCAPQ